MDQIKIGKFIAKLRKSKNMTQQELATKLNVTDRAISNWENGRRMPDISLFKPLCEILDITVNELVNGEKIPTKKIKTKSDEILIKTLKTTKTTKKKSNNLIIFLVIISICLIAIILFIPLKQKNIYPKFDIYSIISFASDVDLGYKVTKQFTYQAGTNKHNIFYYGLDSVQLCDSKENCYSLKSSLTNKQVTIEKIKKYLNSQLQLGNVNNSILYDGGTTIYENDRYSLIFCNTTEGNKDIYIGLSDMVSALKGAYCGRDEYQTKSYIRTYQVMSSSINKNDDEFVDITLRNISGEIGTVTINKSNNIIVGKTYEFSFYTFDKFEDTIENIFKYSTLLEVKETDKLEYEFINEEIYVNKDLDNGAELNELEHVSMTIKEGTLTNKGATIIIHDLSGHKYSYGTPFIVEEKVNGKWLEVKNICDNCGFNLIAYGVDKDGKLELSCNWERMYGTLDSGYYRIVKDALPNKERPITKEDILYFSVEFTID